MWWFAPSLVACQKKADVEAGEELLFWQDPRWLTQYSEDEWKLIQDWQCPAGMAAIPGGQVQSVWHPVWGEDRSEIGEPRSVAGFCLDRFEYPNQRFAVPRVHVSWIEAQQLCRQAGKRLCLEDEWELACTMGRDWAYSYGPEREPRRCNADQPVGTLAAIAPAGSRFECRNRWGVFDLNGNVSEWVATTEKRPDGEYGILRGGTAWRADQYGGSCWSRHGHPIHDYQYGDDGFRCCADPTRR